MNRKFFCGIVSSLVIICMLSACSIRLGDSGPSKHDDAINYGIETSDADYIIYDFDSINVFKKDKNNQLELTKRVKRKDSDIRYWREFFRNFGNTYATRSSVSPDNNRVSMVTIDSSTLAQKRFELDKNDDMFSLCIDDSYIYFSTPYAYSKIIFHRLSHDLADVEKFEFKCDKAVQFPIAMQPVGDNIFVLTGMYGFKNKPTDYLENHLFKFDRNFNLIKDIDLNFNDSGYQGMAYDGKHKLYITKSIEKVVNNKIVPSREIICFDIEKEKELKRYQLSESMPRFIKFDAERNKLIIMRDYYQPGDLSFTILSLANGEEQVFSLQDAYSLPGQPKPPYFSMKNGICHFLLRDRIVVYDTYKKERVDLPLTKCDLKEPSFMIVKTLPSNLRK